MQLFKKDDRKVIKEKLLQLQIVPGLFEFVQTFGFVAGGAVRDVVRSKTPKDWDIFFKTEGAKDEFIRKFAGKMIVTGIGNYNFHDFQFITLYTGSPEEVVKTFDWNVNQVWYNPTTDVINGERRSNDLWLNFDCDKPLSAMLRLPYMLSKGYIIEPYQYMVALSYLSQRVQLSSETDVLSQHEWMSSGGGISESLATGAVRNAKEQAKIRTKLYKVLK